MGVYVFLFVLLFLFTLSDSNKVSRPYIAFTSVLLFVLIGFRDIKIGPDTDSYVEYFREMANTSFSSLLNDNYFQKEPLYSALTWVTAQFTVNYTVYFLVFALLPAFAIFYVLQDCGLNKKDTYIGTLILFILGIFAFFLSGLRQTMAMSVVFLSYPHLRDSRLVKFIITILVASLFHNSALLFLIIYPFRNFKLKFIHIAVIVVLYMVSAYLTQDVVQSFASFFFKDRFSIYGDSNAETLSYSGLIMQSILYIFCLLYKKRLINKDPSNIVLLNVITIALVFQSMSTVLAEMFRLSMYFSIFYIILIPRAINILNSKNIRLLAYAIFCVLSLIYLFAISTTYLPEYKFALNN